MLASFWSIMKYGIGFALLGYVIHANWEPKSGSPGLKDILDRPFHPGPLLLAAVVLTTALSLTFFRWYLLVRAQNLPFTMYNAFRLGLVGYYYNTFLPGSVGGDIIKAWAIAKEQSRRTVAIATVIIDRVIGLWALVWFVALCGGMFWLVDNPLLAKNLTLKLLVRSCAIIVLISTAVWVAVGFLSQNRADRFGQRLEAIPKVGHSLGELWRAVWLYRKQPRAVFYALLISLVGHTGWVLVFHLSIRAFETPNPEVDIGTMAEHLLIVPVGMTVQAMIPLPGGIGGGEAAFGQLYELIDKPRSNGIVGSLAQRVPSWLVGFIGYLIYLQMRRSLPTPESASPDSLPPQLEAEQA